MASSWSNFGKPVRLSSLISSGQAVRIPGGGGAANTVQGAMNKANQANEARYGQALGIYDQMLANTGMPGGGRAATTGPINPNANTSRSGPKGSLPATTGPATGGGAGTAPASPAGGFSFGQLENQLLD